MLNQDSRGKIISPVKSSYSIQEENSVDESRLAFISFRGITPFSLRVYDLPNLVISWRCMELLDTFLMVSSRAI